ncbi:hypothetical protein [Polaromonas glacialis]|uniref:hypothetical protein n=1 Tax=Polaromonas glacialis TaxID=866564 RepID=UPI0004955E68|nr:hypothetical protein [Polaromonas glacialis]
MAQKTNFSFEVQYPADSSRSEAQRDQLMDSLQATLQQLLAAQDREAEVLVSDSHKGSGNKLVELTTTLEDAPLAGILKAFSGQHGVSVTAFE